MPVPKLEPLTPNTTWTMPDGTLSLQGYNFLYSVSLRLGAPGANPQGYAEIPSLIVTNRLELGANAVLAASGPVFLYSVGIGSVYIYPNPTPGEIDNMAIGQSLPRAGKFTSLQSTGAFTTAGAVTGATVQAIGGFGCNGKTPQTPYPCNVPNSYFGGPFGLSSGVDMGLLVATVRDIRLALIAAGIIS